MIAKTGFLREFRTGSQGECVFDEPEDIVSFCRRDEGAVVASFLVFLSGNLDTGKWLISDPDIGVGLGVAKVDVVFRLVFFDERVFKDEGLHVRVGTDVVDI